MAKYFTLRPFVKDTVVADPDFRPDDRLQFEPLTPGALDAAETAYVAERRAGGFTVRHETSPERPTVQGPRASLDPLKGDFIGLSAADVDIAREKAF